MKKTFTILSCAVIMTAAMPEYTFAEDSQVILVTSTAELTAALSSVKAGDEIVLKEGIYESDPNNGRWRPFEANASGTAEQPIILRSEDPENPATICCNTTESKCALYITGSYWEIRDLKVCNAAKGIFLAQSEHSVISGCEVFNIGDEAIHIIDNSSYNLVENCKVHDTGKLNPKYGEGVANALGIYLDEALRNAE